MRPRKRIVLYGGSELQQSLLRVVLDVWGYRVEMEMTKLAPDAFLLLDFTGEEFAAFEAQRWEACPQSGVVSVQEKELREQGGMAELMNRLRIAAMSLRERGRTKGTWRVAA